MVYLSVVTDSLFFESIALYSETAETKNCKAEVQHGAAVPVSELTLHFLTAIIQKLSAKVVFPHTCLHRDEKSALQGR